MRAAPGRVACREVADMLQTWLRAFVALVMLGCACWAKAGTEDLRNMLQAGIRGDQATVLALEQKGEA